MKRKFTYSLIFGCFDQFKKKKKKKKNMTKQEMKRRDSATNELGGYTWPSQLLEKIVLLSRNRPTFMKQPSPLGPNFSLVLQFSL